LEKNARLFVANTHTLSLPVFGEGGRAKRGRVGITGTVLLWQDPTPTLPEDGEGEERRPMANEQARQLRKTMTRQEVLPEDRKG